jgi:hypothetical protein
MMRECSAGATVSTCKGLFNHNFILSINKINSMKVLCNVCFHELEKQFFIEDTKPRQLDTEGTGTTFAQNVCIY